MNSSVDLIEVEGLIEMLEDDRVGLTKVDCATVANLIRSLLSERDAAVKRASEFKDERDIALAVIMDACDLLAERTYGNPARSPGHNARLMLERIAAGEDLTTGGE